MGLYDKAQEMDQLQRDASIAAARKPSKEGPIYTGTCAFCADALPSPKRFCDADCRDGWEKESDAKKRNGNPALIEDGEGSEA